MRPTLMQPLVESKRGSGNMSSVEIQDRQPTQAAVGMQKPANPDPVGRFDASDAGQVRRFISELEASAWALSALGCALEAGILDHLAVPQALPEITRRTGVPEALIEGILDVLVGLGLVRRAGDQFVCEAGLASWASGRAKEFLLASLHSNRLQSSQLVERAMKRTLSLRGWCHADTEVLVPGNPFSAVGWALDPELISAPRWTRRALDGSFGKLPRRWHWSRSAGN
jgi:hypothetical protein